MRGPQAFSKEHDRHTLAILTPNPSSTSQNHSDKREGEICTNCKKVGHYRDQCWFLYPHLGPKGWRAAKITSAVDSTHAGSLLLALCAIFGGFVLPHPSMPQWLKWGFWVSPLTYSEIGQAVNEFLAPRWQKEKIQSSNVTIVTQTLISRGLNYAGYYYWIVWIGLGALIGFIFLFNFAFTLALTFK